MRNASPRGFFMASFLINGFLIYYGWIVGESAGGYGFRRPNSGVCRPELRRSSLPAVVLLFIEKTSYGWQDRCLIHQLVSIGECVGGAYASVPSEFPKNKATWCEILEDFRSRILYSPEIAIKPQRAVARVVFRTMAEPGRRPACRVSLLQWQAVESQLELARARLRYQRSSAPSSQLASFFPCSFA